MAGKKKKRHQDPRPVWIYIVPGTVLSMLRDSVRPPKKSMGRSYHYSPHLTDKETGTKRVMYGTCSRSQGSGSWESSPGGLVPSFLTSNCFSFFLFSFTSPLLPFALLRPSSFLMLHLLLRRVPVFKLVRGLTSHFIGSATTSWPPMQLSRLPVTWLQWPFQSREPVATPSSCRI